ncbi:MAG: outer membrane protein assembly factor BamB family protein [Planctomycetota bacterium]
MGEFLPEPRLLWRTSVGLGPSSPVVSGGRLYAMGHAKGEKKNRGTDTVYCLDAASGAEIWRHSYDCQSCESQDVRFDGPRATPTADGGAVFALSLEGHLFAFDAASGRILWSRHLLRDLGGRLPLYGYCSSPLVHAGKVILELNAPEAAYVALDRSSGAVVWKARDGQVTSGSPVLMRLEGRDLAVSAGGGAIVALDAEDGREVWRHGTWGHAWMGPVVSGNRVFMANASLPRGCGVLAIEGSKPRVLWEDRGKKFQTLHSNSVVWRGHIHGFDNTGTDYQKTDSKKSSLKCLVLDTGEVRWEAPRMGWGNLIVFDEKLVIFREGGELVVADATPEAYRERLRAALLGGKSWSVPALSGGRLWVRNNEGALACYQILSD